MSSNASHSFSCGGFGSQGRAVEVALHDLLQPRLELPEIDGVFLKLRIGEVAVCSLFRNLRLEIPALVEEFDVLLVAIRLEAADDLFLLPPIEGDGLERTDSPDIPSISFSMILRRRIWSSVLGSRQTPLCR